MARTNLPITNLTANGAVLNPVGTAIDQANGMNITLASGAIPAAPNASKLVLYVANTAAATKTVTVGAGLNATYNNVPAFEASKGSITTGNLSATTGTAFVGPFEPARVVQADGSINVDFSAGATGTILALLVPRVV